MAETVYARRTDVEFSFDGFDMSDVMPQYYTSFTYTDAEEDESDDISITLQDRNMTWIHDWLPEVIDKAAAEMLTISPTIVQKYWDGTESEVRLPCGTFEVDSVSMDGPPATITIKGTSLPYSSRIRQGVNTKTWENVKLSAIAAEIASNAGLFLMYDAGFDPQYTEKEQKDQADITFLSRLCKDAGITMKVSADKLILFDPAVYEAKEAVTNIYYGVNIFKGTQEQHVEDGIGPGGLKGNQSFPIKYRIYSTSADVQYDACRVSYVIPTTGEMIEGYAYSDDYDEENTPRTLEVTMKVSSIGEAEWYAAKRLRLQNKYAKTASFTLPGNPALVAGVTVNVQWFGGFSGKYYVYKATHTVKPSSGYQTKVDLRYVSSI